MRVSRQSHGLEGVDHQTNKAKPEKKNQIFMHDDLACPCQIYDLIVCIDLLCFSIPLV